jgi:Ribonuclease G/E
VAYQCIDGWVISDSNSKSKLVYSKYPLIVKAIKTWLNKNIADSAIGEFDASKTITESILQLQNSFGHGYLNIPDYRSIVEKAI